jgi:hypothetical protein
MSQAPRDRRAHHSGGVTQNTTAPSRNAPRSGDLRRELHGQLGLRQASLLEQGQVEGAGELYLQHLVEVEAATGLSTSGYLPWNAPPSWSRWAQPRYRLLWSFQQAAEGPQVDAGPLDSALDGGAGMELAAGPLSAHAGTDSATDSGGLSAADAVAVQRLAVPGGGAQDDEALFDWFTRTIDGAGPGRRPTDREQAFLREVHGRAMPEARIHEGGASRELADAVGARAFTVGRDIYIPGGVHLDSPGSAELLAHEATHVAQAAEGRLPGTSGGGLSVSDPAQAHEREAEAKGREGRSLAGSRGGDPWGLAQAPALDEAGQALVMRLGVALPEGEVAPPEPLVEELAGELARLRAARAADGWRRALEAHDEGRGSQFVRGVLQDLQGRAMAGDESDAHWAGLLGAPEVGELDAFAAEHAPWPGMSEALGLRLDALVAQGAPDTTGGAGDAASPYSEGLSGAGLDAAGGSVQRLGGLGGLAGRAKGMAQGALGQAMGAAQSALPPQVSEGLGALRGLAEGGPQQLAQQLLDAAGVDTNLPAIREHLDGLQQAIGQSVLPALEEAVAAGEQAAGAEEGSSESAESGGESGGDAGGGGMFGGGGIGGAIGQAAGAAGAIPGVGDALGSVQDALGQVEGLVSEAMGALDVGGLTQQLTDELESRLGDALPGPVRDLLSQGIAQSAGGLVEQALGSATNAMGGGGGGGIGGAISGAMEAASGAMSGGTDAEGLLAGLTEQVPGVSDLMDQAQEQLQGLLPESVSGALGQIPGLDEIRGLIGDPGALADRLLSEVGELANLPEVTQSWTEIQSVVRDVAVPDLSSAVAAAESAAGNNSTDSGASGSGTSSTDSGTGDTATAVQTAIENRLDPEQLIGPLREALEERLGGALPPELLDALSGDLAGGAQALVGQVFGVLGNLGEGIPGAGDLLSRGQEALGGLLQFAGGEGRRDTGVHQRARQGVSGGGGRLPHLDRIQQAFGQHDVSGVRAHRGADATEAARAIGASAYATGEDVAFAGAPDLHTAAHEAAHVIQQRQGVSLPSGVGAAGDTYERHADAVADAVVSGGTAASLLGGTAGAGLSAQVVQRNEDGAPDADADSGQGDSELARLATAGLEVAVYDGGHGDSATFQATAAIFAAEHRAVAARGGRVVIGHPLRGDTAQAAAAAVSQTLEAVRAELGNDQVRISTVAVFTHGYPYRLNHSDTNDAQDANASGFSAALDASLTVDARVVLYACATGSASATRQADMDSAMAGTTTPAMAADNASGGDTGYADQLRDGLTSSPEGSQREVWGHRTYGHATSNPTWRQFQGDQSSGDSQTGSPFGSEDIRAGSGVQMEIVEWLRAQLGDEALRSRLRSTRARRGAGGLRQVFEADHQSGNVVVDHLKEWVAREMPFVPQPLQQPDGTVPENVKQAFLQRFNAQFPEGGGTPQPMQKSIGPSRVEDVGAAAAEGVSGSGGRLPHLERIQRAFGEHDLSGVRAHTGTAASDAARSIGASAYATGEDVAFAGSPDLHTAAHETAHIIQQRQGLSLSGGVGQAGDAYERHADAVADAVVQGEPAQQLLGPVQASSATASGGEQVQRTAAVRSGDPFRHSIQVDHEPSRAEVEQLVGEELGLSNFVLDENGNGRVQDPSSGATYLVRVSATDGSQSYVITITGADESQTGGTGGQSETDSSRPRQRGPLYITGATYERDYDHEPSPGEISAFILQASGDSVSVTMGSGGRGRARDVAGSTRYIVEVIPSLGDDGVYMLHVAEHVGNELDPNESVSAEDFLLNDNAPTNRNRDPMFSPEGEEDKESDPPGIGAEGEEDGMGTGGDELSGGRGPDGLLDDGSMDINENEEEEEEEDNTGAYRRRVYDQDDPSFWPEVDDYEWNNNDAPIGNPPEREGIYYVWKRPRSTGPGALNRNARLPGGLGDREIIKTYDGSEYEIYEIMGESTEAIRRHIHEVLSLLGMLPVIGVVFDAADTALYVLEGDWASAAISATAMVEGIGTAATLIKLASGKAGVKVVGSAIVGIPPRRLADRIRRAAARSREGRTAAAEAATAPWARRRAFSGGDSGLKDHALRHSNLSPEEYLARGQATISSGRSLKGGGRAPDCTYYVRRVGEDEYSASGMK